MNDLKYIFTICKKYLPLFHTWQHSVHIVILKGQTEGMFKFISNEVMETKVLKTRNACVHSVTNHLHSGSIWTNIFDYHTEMERNINVTYVRIVVIIKLDFKNTSMPFIQV